MARARKHKDVEFFVEGIKQPYDTFDEAAAIAVVRSVSDGRPSQLDVTVFSKAGARWLAGEDGVEQYEDDPEASVFERIVIRADSEGRIP